MKYIFFLTLILYFQQQAAFCQNKKAMPPQIEDIFGDLPINDPSSRSMLVAGENGEEKIRKYIVVNGFLNKNSCYVGEPVLLTFELLSALKSTSTIQRPPSLTGFQIMEMDTDNDFPKFRKKDGISYSLFTIKRSQLIPITEGDLEIGPIAVNNEVTYTRDEKKYRYSGVVTGKPVKLIVHPLPAAGRPERFNGAVGNFKIESKVVSDSFRAGENNVLELTIRGAGNFTSLITPAVYWPAGFRQFDISEKSKLNEKVFPVQGNRIISVPFIAEQAGEYIIPSVELSFFDPSAKKYISTSSNPIRLVVTPTLRPQTGITSVPPVKASPANYWWLILVVAIPGLTVLIYFLLKKRRVVNDVRRVELERQKEALRVIEERQEKIRSAVAQLETLEPTKNYIATFKQVLLDFLHDKFNTSAPAETLTEQVTAADKDTGEALAALLQECDMWLYAPISPDTETRQKLVSALHSIIEKVNRIYP